MNESRPRAPTMPDTYRIHMSEPNAISKFVPTGTRHMMAPRVLHSVRFSRIIQ